VATAANMPDSELVQAQRDLILDPHDPQIIAEARKAGITDAWLEACRRSPVYKLVKQWKLALPLHPEFRTMPMLFYIPPLSPLVTSAGKDSPSEKDVFAMAKPNDTLVDLAELGKMRIPLKYLADLLAAGNVEPVKESLLRQLAVRHYERSLRVDKKPNVEVLKQVGLTEAEAKAIVRGISLAFYHERFVVPTTHYEDTANAYDGFKKVCAQATNESCHHRLVWETG
jgi:nitrate reductase beta subunit